jgi:microcystin-dependent protein
MTARPPASLRVVLPRRRFLLRLLAAAAGAAWPWRREVALADTRSIEPYLGEIMLLSFNYAPSGWALCNGQLLPINQNQVLFSLLGTTYGGNGQTNFALPDLRGRVAIHKGQGPGLSPRQLGEIGGEQAHTLTLAELCAHTHVARAHSASGAAAAPAADVVPARNPAQIPAWSPTADTLMGSGAVANAGGSQAHLNMQPFLALNYVIALQGVFPAP